MSGLLMVSIALPVAAAWCRLSRGASRSKKVSVLVFRVYSLVSGNMIINLICLANQRALPDG